MFHAQGNQVFWREGNETYQLILTFHNNPPVLGAKHLSVNDMAKQIADVLNADEDDLCVLMSTGRS